MEDSCLNYRKVILNGSSTRLLAFELSVASVYVSRRSLRWRKLIQGRYLPIMNLSPDFRARPWVLTTIGMFFSKVRSAKRIRKLGRKRSCQSFFGTKSRDGPAQQNFKDAGMSKTAIARSAILQIWMPQHQNGSTTTSPAMASLRLRSIASVALESVNCVITWHNGWQVQGWARFPPSCLWTEAMSAQHGLSPRYPFQRNTQCHLPPTMAMAVSLLLFEALSAWKALGGNIDGFSLRAAFLPTEQALEFVVLWANQIWSQKVRESSENMVQNREHAENFPLKIGRWRFSKRMAWGQNSKVEKKLRRFQQSELGTKTFAMPLIADIRRLWRNSRLCGKMEMELENEPRLLIQNGIAQGFSRP